MQTGSRHPSRFIPVILLFAIAGIIALTQAPNPAPGDAPSPSPAATTSSAAFTLTSSAVENGMLLAAFRGEKKDENGVEKSIPLAWSGVPAGTGSLAVIMFHYPFPEDHTQINTYLLLWDIAPTVTGIPHGKADDGPWFMGANKDGTVISYTSPNSPNPNPHEYTIVLYALSETPPTLPRESSLAVNHDAFMKALSTVKILGSASLTFVSSGSSGE